MLDQRLASNASRRTVLVVEDDENTRALTGFMLRTTHEVICADGVTEALAAAAENRFDVFVIDINLGQGDYGTDLLHRLRRQPQYRETPAVAVTAYAMPGDREKFLEAGFDCYQSKPFTKKQILGVVEEALLKVAA